MLNTKRHDDQQTVKTSASADDHIVVLTEYEKTAIQEIIAELPPDFALFNVDNTLLNFIQLKSLQLPPRLIESLIRFKRTPNRYGTLLFRNLPTDLMLPMTPANGEPSTEKDTFISEYLLFLFMLYLGEPIGYADEKNGQLVHDICPVQGSESKMENSGSETYFTFHTEDAIHPFRPDHLALICLRNDHECVAKTDTASIVNAMKLLPSAAIELLRQPLYRLNPPSSFISNDYFRIVPVLTGSLIEPDMCMNSATMSGLTLGAQWALDTLKEALHQVSIGHVLIPGDLVIIDNRTTTHGRTSFKARYDGEDRWLQRLFTITDFRRSSYSRIQNKHVCIPLKIQLSLDDNEVIS